MINKDKNQSTRSKSQKVHEPILLDEDNVHYKGKPPYLMIGILVFFVLYSFWNVYITEKRERSSPVSVEKNEQIKALKAPLQK